MLKARHLFAGVQRNGATNRDAFGDNLREYQAALGLSGSVIEVIIPHPVHIKYVARSAGPSRPATARGLCMAGPDRHGTSLMGWELEPQALYRSKSLVINMFSGSRRSGTMVEPL